MKRFSDFATVNTTIIGDKIKIEDVLGKEIEVIGYKMNESKYKKKDNDKVLTLQFRLNGEDKILFTGSNVLMDQVETYKDELPFLAKIEKVNKFYTFT
jgi:hypothetical protein